MREMLVAAVLAAALTLGCTPSDQSPPVPEATPTVAAGDQITDMDFESGEVEQAATETDEPETQPTPPVP